MALNTRAAALPVSPDTLGTAGNDKLWGIANTVHALRGGKGDDIYYLKSPTNSVVERSGEGNDTIVTWASYDLRNAPNVENLTVSNDAGSQMLYGRGNAGANHLTGGGSGGQTLNGEGGNDRLTGGLGNDRLDGGAGDGELRVVEKAGGGQRPGVGARAGDVVRREAPVEVGGLAQGRECVGGAAGEASAPEAEARIGLGHDKPFIEEWPGSNGPPKCRGSREISGCSRGFSRVVGVKVLVGSGVAGTPGEVEEALRQS